MDPFDASNGGQLTKQLSQLLGLEISYIQSEHQPEDLPAELRRISVFDSLQNEHPFILKRQDDRSALCLYTHYLKPFNLNSPKEYGYIDVDGQLFLVMDYIQHIPPDWSDSIGYFKAVEWLIKKDRVTSQNLVSIRNSGCFGKMKYYGVQYWLSELEEWSQDTSPNSQARHIWRTVYANQSRIDSYIGELNSVGIQTVVHGDLHMSNILFGEGEFENQLFVIDWTEPHIGSVTKDLASLYDNAPKNIKEELVRMYRASIDFPSFDEMFAKAKLLRDVGYLAWMAGMISAKAQEGISQHELDRVMQNILTSLE